MISKQTTLRTVIVLIFIGLLGIFFAIFQYNKPHTNVATSKADISLTAQALFSDYESNETSANAKYLDQIIEVTGPIVNITTVKDQKIISIGEDGMFGSVKCHLTPQETKKNQVLKIGQSITAKGICTGYLMDVILVKAVLIN